jgi:hypothetical protein
LRAAAVSGDLYNPCACLHGKYGVVAPRNQAAIQDFRGERARLDVAKRRRDEVRLGKVTPLDGEAVLASARQIAGR